MQASFILNAIRKKYPKAAIVPELTIEDTDLPDSGEVVRTHNLSYAEIPDGHKFSRRIDRRILG